MAKDKDSIDRLIAESERLRQELLRTATRLESFSNALLGEVASLRNEAGAAIEGGECDDRA